MSCFAVNDGRNAIPNYAGLGNAVSTIFRQEGIKGLYKGVTPNVWGSGSAWGFYFLLLANLILVNKINITKSLQFVFLVIIQLKLGFKVTILKNLWVQHYI